MTSISKAHQKITWEKPEYILSMSEQPNNAGNLIKGNQTHSDLISSPLVDKGNSGNIKKVLHEGPNGRFEQMMAWISRIVDRSGNQQEASHGNGHETAAQHAENEAEDERREGILDTLEYIALHFLAD